MIDPTLQKLVANGDVVSYTYQNNNRNIEYCVLVFKSGIILKIDPNDFYGDCNYQLNFSELGEVEKIIHDYNPALPYVELGMFLRNNKKKCRNHHNLCSLIYHIIKDWSDNPLIDSHNLADKFLY